ncbi:hypothetical protein Asi03nite_06610 [Actinoplanes siamensis]|uniref:Uncharacterized protein n=1 Tax=Actinoplanes siamensis TaxID=1223317 RepID=A0A919KCE6_9ACTN|nr:hypothetical protein Asi03nite_06610 [Actinoplanes siamensis]
MRFALTWRNVDYRSERGDCDMRGSAIPSAFFQISRVAMSPLRRAGPSGARRPGARRDRRHISW